MGYLYQDGNCISETLICVAKPCHIIGSWKGNPALTRGMLLTSKATGHKKSNGFVSAAANPNRAFNRRYWLYVRILTLALLAFSIRRIEPILDIRLTPLHRDPNAAARDEAVSPRTQSTKITRCKIQNSIECYVKTNAISTHYASTSNNRPSSHFFLAALRKMSKSPLDSHML